MLNSKRARLGVLLGTAVVIGSAAAAGANPTLAQQTFRSIANAIACNSSSACVQISNAGNGPGAEGDNTGGGYGLLGRSASISAGVAGINSANGSGVYGQTVNGSGINGYATGSGVAINAGASGSGTGVYAQAANNNGIQGTTTNPTTKNRSAAGIFGYDNSTDGGRYNNGVFGQSNNGTGVGAKGPIPFQGQNQFSHQVFQVDGSGNITISGLIYTSGFCNTGCDRSPEGRRLVTYVPRQSLPTIEDFGQARLVNGQAHVWLDPAFSSGIDRRLSYMVFTEAEGDNHGLYVSNKTASGFSVHESQKGRSTLDFSYRIVAKPFGSTEGRLHIVDMKAMESGQRAPGATPTSTSR